MRAKRFRHARHKVIKTENNRAFFRKPRTKSIALGNAHRYLSFTATRDDHSTPDLNRDALKSVEKINQEGEAMEKVVLIDKCAVLELARISSATLWRLVKRGLFPKRRKVLGDRRTFFSREEVERWLRDERVRRVD
jgi:predicted DNA-binding transcriptional regulator AlpA